MIVVFRPLRQSQLRRPRAACLQATQMMMSQRQGSQHPRQPRNQVQVCLVTILILMAGTYLVRSLHHQSDQRGQPAFLVAALTMMHQLQLVNQLLELRVLSSRVCRSLTAKIVPSGVVMMMTKKLRGQRRLYRQQQSQQQPCSGLPGLLEAQRNLR